MAIEITCPSCQTAFRVSEEILGKKVRCKSCQEPFTTRESKSSRQETRDEEVDDRMRSTLSSARPSRRRRDEEDSGSDLPVVSRRRDAEEDRNPRKARRRKPQKSGSLGLIIGAAVAGVVLLIGGVVGAVLMLKPAHVTPTQVVQGPPPVKNALANPGVPVVAAPKPDVPAVPAPKPDVAAAAAPKPEVPPPPAPKPEVPAPPAPKPEVPAPPPPKPEVPAPIGGNALSYRWQNGPHVYSVYGEIEKEKTIEVYRGLLIIRTKKNAEGLRINVSSGLRKQEKPRGGDVKTPFPQAPPMIGWFNWINIDALGQVLAAGPGGMQLPLMLGEMGMFLIERLPPDDRKTWETKGVCTLEDVSGVRWFGRMRTTIKGAPPPKKFQAKELTVYTRGDTVGDTVTITKRYEMKVDPSKADPGLKLSGDSTIRFDTKDGMPRGIEFKGSLALSNKTMTLRIPVTVTYKLIEGAERERILKPPPRPKAPKVEPKVFTDAEITQILADLRGADDNKRWAAVNQLGKAAKATFRREEVARALNPLLEDKSFPRRMACLVALRVWGTIENGPSVIPLLSDKSGPVQINAIRVLGEIREERAIEPIAKFFLVRTARGEATLALQKIGSKAEPVVLPYLQHRTGAVRGEACKTLKVIGTSASKTALEELTKDKELGVRALAKEALAAIAARP